jgi:phosphate transport system permease protein
MIGVVGLGQGRVLGERQDPRELAPGALQTHPRPPSGPLLTGKASPALERLLESVLLGCALLSVATTAAIVGLLGWEAFGFFRVVPLAQFLFDDRWTPLLPETHFGIWPLVAGTLSTSAIALLVAVPLGILGAIYLNEFAAPRVRRALSLSLGLLAGVPTVVYGYLALGFVTPALQRLVPGLAAFNALGAGLVLGVMLVPMISALSEDALARVPNALREGAYALGAGRLATLFRVVLPAAASGIAGALVLAASRAVGETMIVAMAAGQAPRATLDPRLPVESLAAYVVQVSAGETLSGTLAQRAIFVVGAVLFLMTYVMNALSRHARRRFGHVG